MRLTAIEKPRNPFVRLMYWAMNRQFGRAITPMKVIFARMVESGDRPEQIAERDGLLQVGDDQALAGWIDAVLAEHPAEAARFLGGERRLQGVLVGMVMKKSGGRADPNRVNQLLVERVTG